MKNVTFFFLNFFKNIWQNVELLVCIVEMDSGVGVKLSYFSLSAVRPRHIKLSYFSLSAVRPRHIKFTTVCEILSFIVFTHIGDICLTSGISACAKLLQILVILSFFLFKCAVQWIILQTAANLMFLNHYIYIYIYIVFK